MARFYDQFGSSVDKNPKLSKVQKLIYLKRCLTGPAERLIKNLETTEADYDSAVKILTDRYHNERNIVRNLLTRNIECRPVRTENAFQLRLLHNTFHETALAFESINNWSTTSCGINWCSPKSILNHRRHGN